MGMRVAATPPSDKLAYTTICPQHQRPPDLANPPEGRRRGVREGLKEAAVCLLSVAATAVNEEVTTYTTVDQRTDSLQPFVLIRARDWLLQGNEW